MLDYGARAHANTAGMGGSHSLCGVRAPRRQRCRCSDRRRLFISNRSLPARVFQRSRTHRCACGGFALAGQGRRRSKSECAGDTDSGSGWRLWPYDRSGNQGLIGFNGGDEWADQPYLSR